MFGFIESVYCNNSTNGDQINQLHSEVCNRPKKTNLSDSKKQFLQIYKESGDLSWVTVLLFIAEAFYLCTPFDINNMGKLLFFFFFNTSGQYILYPTCKVCFIATYLPCNLWKHLSITSRSLPNLRVNSYMHFQFTFSVWLFTTAPARVTLQSNTSFVPKIAILLPGSWSQFFICQLFCQ